jgi:hypothetical protein
MLLYIFALDTLLFYICSSMSMTQYFINLMFYYIILLLLLFKHTHINKKGFESNESRGIIPRSIEQIFSHIEQHASPRMRFLVRASYLQIYNDMISDLLKPERSNLSIREDKRRGVFVEGLSEWVVRSPQEIYSLIRRGSNERATGSTRMNAVSSRSHGVFIIITEQSETTYIDERGKPSFFYLLTYLLHLLHRFNNPSSTYFTFRSFPFLSFLSYPFLFSLSSVPHSNRLCRRAAER